MIIFKNAIELTRLSLHVVISPLLLDPNSFPQIDIK